MMPKDAITTASRQNTTPSAMLASNTPSRLFSRSISSLSSVRRVRACAMRLIASCRSVSSTDHLSEASATRAEEADQNADRRHGADDLPGIVAYVAVRRIGRLPVFLRGERTRLGNRIL